MGRKKKPFIDRKNASRYTLMHRSQRDVGGDILDGGAMEVGNTGMILWPDPSNNPETDAKVLVESEAQKDTMKEWRNKLAEVGLLEEHDEQYLKPITGAGTFLSAPGKAGIMDKELLEARAKDISEELLAEVTQQFEGIPLAADCMDEDIERALMGDFEEGEFEEIADDFVFDAAREPEQGDQEAFDFDAHIAKLMEDARRQATDEVVPVDGHDWGEKDKDFFAKGKALNAVDEDEDSLFGAGTTLDVLPGVVPSLNPDEERALCEQFEKTLAEYDSDAMGEIYEEDIQGDKPLEGDAQVEAALDNFLQEKEDDIFMRGKSRDEDNAAAQNNIKGGSGFAALVGTRMVPVKELDADQQPVVDEPARPLDEVLREAKKKIKAPELEPPPEEIFIDGKSYYSMKERNPWDCESILSTYSNLDNNPVVIGVESRRSKKKKQQQQKIKLSSKTGLPVMENPVEEDNEEDDDFDDNNQTIISVNRGAARSKKESKEEKRARKAQVKKERQMARIQKKATKEVYKEELLNQTGAGVSDDVAGKAVFRYS